MAQRDSAFRTGPVQTTFSKFVTDRVPRGPRATAWLVALFFATSFGLAVLAKQRIEGQDALPVLPAEIEAATQQSAQEQDLPPLEQGLEDLPLVEDSEPALSADDLPPVEDIPELPEQ